MDYGADEFLVVWLAIAKGLFPCLLVFSCPFDGYLFPLGIFYYEFGSEDND